MKTNEQIGLAFPDPPLVKAPVAVPAWRAARDDGMKRAAKNASPFWKNRARELLYNFAMSGPGFYGWQITQKLREEGCTTFTDRALGPMMTAAAKKGWIEKTEHHERNPLANGCPSPMWKSKLYRAA